MIINDLNQTLTYLRNVDIAVIGDFCLDAYYTIDFTHSEPSLETGKDTLPVSKMRLAMGGASNVANNIIDLGVRNVYPIGVVGDDCYAYELLRLFESKGINHQYIATQKENWDTHVYTKIINDGKELDRYDFGTFNQLSRRTMEQLIASIRELAATVKYFVVNEQFRFGIHSDEFRKELRKVMADYPDVTFIVDCRDYNAEYPNSIHKLNYREGAAICGFDNYDDITTDNAHRIADILYAKWGKPVFMTLGERGCLVRDKNTMELIAGYAIIGRTDPVGAGDSMLAGIIAMLAAGHSAAQAAELGNIVAGVTIQKLLQTGTATPAEIIEFAQKTDIAVNHELAQSLRRAKYLNGSEIELVSSRKPSGEYQFAVFDHDGTFSTLRQGWEAVMEPVMMRAILGDKYDIVDQLKFNAIQEAVKSYIDKTTGIQTLVQMQGLVKMVRDYGYTPDAEILDEFGYKKIYNDALMEMVESRMAKFSRGELSIEDVTIKGSLQLLELLRSKGMTLFLASGTDEDDVRREAEFLGYAHYFNGGIRGSVNNVAHEPKKIVLNNIINSIGAAGASKIITFGDGPVEIRETIKEGGYAVGIASDEVQRFGLNEVKRRRLILAGADIVIPDYSQLKTLKSFLFNE